MKKILFLFLSFFILTSFTSASFYETDAESIDRFIKSPNFLNLESIEDEKTKFCEEAFLDAYRRREFSELENLICSDFFEMKIEDELNYKKSVLWDRWIY